MPGLERNLQLKESRIYNKALFNFKIELLVNKIKYKDNVSYRFIR